MLKLAISGVVAGACALFSWYGYTHYTYVDGSFLTDQFIYKEMNAIQMVFKEAAQQGFMAGVEEGATSCKNHT